MLDGDRGSQSFDGVDVGLGERADDAFGLGGEGLDESALPFYEKRVEGKRALSLAGDACQAAEDSMGNFTRNSM